MQQKEQRIKQITLKNIVISKLKALFTTFGFLFIILLFLALFFALVRAIKVTEIIFFIFSISVPMLLIFICTFFVLTFFDIFKWLCGPKQIILTRDKMTFSQHVIPFQQITKIKKSISYGKYSAHYNGTYTIYYLQNGRRRKQKFYSLNYEGTADLLQALTDWNSQKHEIKLQKMETELQSNPEKYLELAHSKQKIWCDEKQNCLVIKRNAILNKKVISTIPIDKQYSITENEVLIHLEAIPKIQVSFFDIYNNRPYNAICLSVDNYTTYFWIAYSKKILSLLYILQYLKLNNKIKLKIKINSEQTFF